jgi:ABC-type bacteriocin/lantibiotic exporter with double-glycine peptidase domain
VNWRALRQYLRYYRGLRGRLTMGVLLSLAQALALIPIPLLVGAAIDKAIPGQDTGSLVRIGLVILALTLTGAGLSLLATFVNSSLVREAVKRLRLDAVVKLFAVSRRYVTSQEPSVLHDQIVQETSRVYAGTSAVLESILPGTVLVMGIGSVLVVMNATLAAVTLAFVPAIFIAGRYIGRSLRTRVRSQHESFERFSRFTLRILRSMDLIRTHGAEDMELEKTNRLATELETAGLARSMWSTVYSLTQSTLLAVAGASVLIVGGVFVIGETMTLGDLISFYAGFALMRGPLGRIALRVPSIIEGMTSLTHLDDFLTETDTQPYTGTRSVHSTGRIKLVDVTFSYDEEPVLQDVSMELERGKVLAIVGPNGSGKSTIVNLILGFYRPQRGELLADGVPYPEVDLVEFRRSIGVVPQQTVLLHASVHENVTYGRQAVEDEAIQRALRLAQADFVWRLPDGLGTAIGDEGVFLSGGQRQRLAIARAVMHRPSLLILDEPTNHLDGENMAAVMRNIGKLQPRPAILLISHRPEILVDVDEVIELKDGKVVQVRPG